MDIQKLKVTDRKITGRKVKTLRAEGLLPANLFGKDIKSKSITVDRKGFQDVFKKVGETGLVELQMDKGKATVLVSNVQLHPVEDTVMHVDFRQVNLKEKIVASVPVEVVGESPAEKQGLGTMVQMINDLEIEALPADLPEKIDVNVGKLEEVDATILVKDLKVDTKKVTIVDDPEGIVVKIEGIQEEKEPEVVAEVAEGPEAPVVDTEKTEEKPEA